MMLPALTVQDKQVLDGYAEQLAEARRGFNRQVFAIGKVLIEAHDYLAGAGCKGCFMPWVRESCDFSRATAYNYMQMYRTFGGSQNCNLPDSTMRLLAKSPEAAKKAIRLDKLGKAVDSKTAAKLLEEAAPAPAPAVTGNGKAMPEPAADGDGEPPAETGGWEPEEVRPALDKLEKSLSKATRDWGELQTIMGRSDGDVLQLFEGLDQASMALSRLQRRAR